MSGDTVLVSLLLGILLLWGALAIQYNIMKAAVKNGVIEAQAATLAGSGGQQLVQESVGSHARQ